MSILQENMLNCIKIYHRYMSACYHVWIHVESFPFSGEGLFEFALGSEAYFITNILNFAENPVPFRSMHVDETLNFTFLKIYLKFLIKIIQFFQCVGDVISVRCTNISSAIDCVSIKFRVQFSKL